MPVPSNPSHPDAQKTEQDLAWLLACFREVLEEIGEPDLAASLAPNGRPDRRGHAAALRAALLDRVPAGEHGRGEHRGADAPPARRRRGPRGGAGPLGTHAQPPAAGGRHGGGHRGGAAARARPAGAHGAPDGGQARDRPRAPRELYLRLLEREQIIWTPQEQHCASASRSRRSSSACGAPARSSSSGPTSPPSGATWPTT
jgi:hypothetical protein